MEIRSRKLFIGLLIYPAWLGMMALHEVGHVAHALVSGGVVDRVIIPLVGFSRTDFRVNPHPQFVAWGGAVWGCLIPLVMLAIALILRRGQFWMRLFAGFCLIANGVYLGLGPWMTAGDGHDLIRHGAPRWTLCGIGVLAAAMGLFLWHRAGRIADGSLAKPKAE